MKKKKIDVHMWRMEKIIQRINEINEQRQELIKSGQAQAYPEWFREWEAKQHELRDRFERNIETQVP